jgi:hypothetical protein
MSLWEAGDKFCEIKNGFYSDSGQPARRVSRVNLDVAHHPKLILESGILNGLPQAYSVDGVCRSHS